MDDKKQKSPVDQNDSDLSIDSADAAEQGEAAGLAITSANLRALEPIYFTAMMEEACLFRVVDQLRVMFSRGMLPLGPGRAGAMLYQKWKCNLDRLTTGQRRTVYARVFGIPGGDADVTLNREFSNLWLRFVSTVGMYSAELQSLPPEERSVGPEEVLLSGRALAINLSNHGDGLAWFATPDFKSEIKQVIALLSDPELLIAFGAKSPWEVIHNVAASELGVTPNVQRAHTRAQGGVIIIRWLSNRRSRLLRPRSANILRHEDIVEGRTAVSQNKKPSVYPTDADLVTACEQWLGVTGTQEADLKDQSPLEEPVSPVKTPVPPVESLVPQEGQRDPVA